jgi:hypothetical protein
MRREKREEAALSLISGKRGRIAAILGAALRSKKGWSSGQAIGPWRSWSYYATGEGLLRTDLPSGEATQQAAKSEEPTLCKTGKRQATQDHFCAFGTRHRAIWLARWFVVI